MDPKLLYWTGALINMWAVAALALAGVARIRARDVAGHHRRMLGAAALVLLFVLSYAVKLAQLGREDLPSWEPWAVTLLRIHELFVFIMLLAGGRAGLLARKLRHVKLPDGQGGDPLRVAHRRAGKLAIGAALFGALTASGVLTGMYLA